MKNLLKKPLKLIAAGLFVAAMGFGMSTTLKVSDMSSNVDLLMLSSQTAQGEDRPCNLSTIGYIWRYTSAQPCYSLTGISCGGMWC